jgi:hypothetical protein
MKRLLLILILIFVSCDKSNKTEIRKEFIKKNLKSFYISDKIDHYYLDISDFSVYDILRKNIIVDDQIKLSGLLSGNYPQTISEPNLESDLLKFHFLKTELTEEKKKKVEAIFTQNDSLSPDVASCIPKYRDIFIFKRNDSIIGIAKICNGCGESKFLGTKVDTHTFGLRSELEKLYKIIR